MEQTPSQDKNRVEGCLRHQAPLYALGAWVAPERVNPRHEASFNRYFHKPEPMRAVAREAEGLPGEIIEKRQPSTAVRMGGG